MDSRREFLKKAMLLAAGGQASGVLPSALQQALAIDPAPGSTFLDAEHVVILMQENRSFDHLYGSLRGVRGFNDPRAHTLPDGNPVWLQTNAKGETYAPFRLNIKDTKATWMSCLPHSWTDQTAARNDGKYDRWLDTKASGTREYAGMPLTLGYYNREDLPFYYALADAFTVCDQNFCSSLTGTTPNRLHLWTGTIRAEQSAASPALVWNSDVEYGSWISWRTFPELLEQHGIPWRIYQNELTVPTGLSGEAESWLSNFGDSPLEWFTQFHVKHHAGHRRWLREQENVLTAEVEKLRNLTPQDTKALDRAEKKQEQTRREISQWTEENFAKLPAHEQSLHRRAFTVNSSDPHYRELESLTLNEGGEKREMQVPKGDVLHQFRHDVRTGNLPAVSWLVAPQKFSDHPDSPWYGAWYIAEALQILTDNPDVWRKTIFILCYDENDGYYDHIPPFVPPHPDRPETGKVSPGIETALEHLSPEQEQAWHKSHPDSGMTGGIPVGLGYRVPLVIASPWSRGGFVCSQVFDHTSILQLLEKMAGRWSGREIRETNISSWRRTVCGDLTSAFRPWNDEKTDLPPAVDRREFLASIHQAQFRETPGNFHKFNTAEVQQVREKPAFSPLLPRQEPGVRPSCALPYELSVHGALSADRQSFEIRFAAGNQVFKEQAAGAPFRVYAPGKVRPAGNEPEAFETGRTWNYAVAPGAEVSDQWRLEDFADGVCHLQVHGPNGFFREFRCRRNEPLPDIVLKSGHLHLTNNGSEEIMVSIEDLSYGSEPQSLVAAPGSPGVCPVPQDSRWYDLQIRCPAVPNFLQRFAGRLETGVPGTTDPAMSGA